MGMWNVGTKEKGRQMGATRGAGPEMEGRRQGRLGTQESRFIWRKKTLGVFHIKRTSKNAFYKGSGSTEAG